MFGRICVPLLVFVWVASLTPLLKRLGYLDGADFNERRCGQCRYGEGQNGSDICNLGHCRLLVCCEELDRSFMVRSLTAPIGARCSGGNRLTADFLIPSRGLATTAAA